MKKRVPIIAAVLIGLGLFAMWPGSPIRAAGSAVVKWRECWTPSGDGGPSAVALGDSITEGHHNNLVRVNAEDSYFDVLTCREDSPVEFAANEGVSGETTEDMKARVSEVLDHDPDVVLVLGGTNDVQENVPTATTIANLDEIRVGLGEGGVDRVLWGLIPPSNDTPSENMQLNDAIRDWAAEAGVTLVDYWAPLAAPDGTYLRGMNVDPFHPSAAGAERLADAAEAAMAAPS